MWCFIIITFEHSSATYITRPDVQELTTITLNLPSPHDWKCDTDFIWQFNKQVNIIKSLFRRNNDCFGLF